MDRKAWLDSLKAGDEIACVDNINLRSFVRVIEKITPCQIKLADNCYPRIIGRDGRSRYGDTFIPNTPEAITAQIAKIAHYKIVDAIQYRICPDLTTDQLNRICAILDEAVE